jgi:hypothetical protein
MLFPNRCIFGAVVLLACQFSPTLRGETIVLNPVADATLIQVAPDASLGGADFFNAGTAGNGNRNRALVQFGLAGAIPAGSIINNVSILFDIVRQPAVDLAPATFGLHRVLVSWSEGDKIPAEEGSPGLGSPATNGDATWLYRSLGGAAWAVPGGLAGTDFSAAPSSTTFVYGIGDPVQFESTPELTADVQHWVNNPDSNFGWMLMTETEQVRKSARSFASREDANGGPMLIIEFTPVPEPSTIVLAALGLLSLCALRWKRG